MSKEYLSCAETAKLVRAALKRAFPGVKFSVRSDTYAGGASIRVRWMDGPVTDAVKSVAGAYAGGRFDGMIDMAYNVDSWLLPDGSATWAKSPGSTGSMGMDEPYSYDPPPGAKLVSFGANYIFCDRDYSVPTYTAAVNKVCAHYGMDVPEIKLSGGDPYVGSDIKVPNAGEYLATMVYRELAKEAA